MTMRVKRSLTTGLPVAALALGAATLPPVIAGSGGLWEVSRSATGANAERKCMPAAVALAQWEHRGAKCTRTIVSSTATETVVSYTCAGGGFGQSKMKVITPRTLRIETQGISGGLPFSYTLHARRVGDCQSALARRH